MQFTLINEVLKMMWKTLLLLAVTSVVLAGRINNKRNANYALEIKHDCDYLKKAENLKLDEHEEKEPVQEEEIEEQVEEVNDEPEQAIESDVSISEPEEQENEEKNESLGYEFSYKVIDPYKHDKKGQHERKYGDVIKGVYWLLQPDGYKRTVDYHTDKHNGFQAKVSYSKSEEPPNEEEYAEPKSEYYIKTYHGSERHVPVKEEEAEPEQDKQEESAQHIPIYVI